jgi:hypothetical protein
MAFSGYPRVFYRLAVKIALRGSQRLYGIGTHPGQHDGPPGSATGSRDRGPGVAETWTGGGRGTGRGRGAKDPRPAPGQVGDSRWGLIVADSRSHSRWPQ